MLNAPGAKRSIQPWKQEAACGGERSRSPLLPGLPDDLAIACLIRVQRAEHGKLRLVCRRWYRLLAGNYYYSLRKSLGMAEQWIYIVKRDNEGRISWEALDPLGGLWHRLPPIPADFSGALGFGCAVLSGCHLYLLGGKDPLKGAMRRVVFYSARTNKWHRAPDMLRRRHLFGSCVINNCLYVGGGESEGGLHRSLRSAEVYDPNKNRWSFIADMTTSMLPFIGVVYDGKWYLKGLGSNRQVLTQVYFPEADSWYSVHRGMVNGWRNPTTCSSDGRLYAVDCKDGCKLRVYDRASDSWCRHSDSGTHMSSSQALEAAALVSLDHGKLFVIRNNLSLSVVNVADGRTDGEWETVAGRGGQIKSFVTNILANIAGRKRLSPHILHCQVLQA